MLKHRYQNPVVGDTVRLLLTTYNSNNRVDLDSVTGINIYTLDRSEVTDDNRDGRRLVEEIPWSSGRIIKVPDTTGEYYVDVELVQDQYVIGPYIDSWSYVYQEEEITNENVWRIYPNLFIATPIPIVYDFQFRFRPNRIRVGSKRYLIIEVEPNVPNISDLKRYYLNLAISSPLKIFVEMACVDCMPKEKDLRMVIDGDDVIYRENCRAYYMLDTTEMACGEYYVWFEMACGESLHVAEKQVLQIFE